MVMTTAKAPLAQYQFLPKQLEFFKNCDEIPFSAYIGGFGSGKTHCLVIQAMREATRPSYGLVGAPTYRLLADTTRRKFFALCPPKLIRQFIKSENKVILINGSEILFRSLDKPEALTNLGLDWFCLDEIGEVELDVFRMLQGRLREGKGSLHGDCVGNPAGPAHWTYEYFALRKTPSYRLVTATSEENIFLPSQYLEEMKSSFGVGSTYYKRFFMGQFVAPEGAIWPNFDTASFPTGHVLTDEAVKQMRFMRYGRVIDFGIEHPFVCLWFGITGDEKIIFLDEYFATHATIRQHCLAIREKERGLYERFGVFDINASYTDHDAVSRTEIENCEDENGNFIGFSCIPAEKAVLEGILLVFTLIEKRQLAVTERCTKTIRQVISYHTKPKEKTDKEVPVKKQDDACDCIRMACAMEMAYTSVFIRGRNEYSTAGDIYTGRVQ
jgi:PBSX family phage terminase large subunit